MHFSVSIIMTQNGCFVPINFDHLTFFFRHLIGYHNNMVVLPISNMRLTLHQVAAGFFPSLFLNEQERMYFRPMSEDFAILLQESGYLHIQATKPDTVGELII